MSTNQTTSRQQAKEQGLKRYFTGLACKAGHVSERLVSTKACIACDQIRLANWKLANAETLKASARASYKANREQISEKRKAYRQLNPDFGREYNKRNAALRNERSRQWRKTNAERAQAYLSSYVKNNRHAVNAKAARRRAALLNATPAWADQEKIKTVYLEAKRLQEQDGIKRDVDHIIPLKGRNVCGLHVHQNLQVLSSVDNRRKHVKHSDEPS